MGNASETLPSKDLEMSTRSATMCEEGTLNEASTTAQATWDLPSFRMIWEGL